MENLIKAIHQTAIYKLKEGTKTSYYFHSGIRILPNRIGFNKFQFAPTQRTGRNKHEVIAQLKATFNKSEISKYKQNKPFNIHTNIWQITDFLDFIGYGSIGITSVLGKINDTNDLVIIYSNSTNWQEIEIHFFPGMLMKMEEVFCYLSHLKRCNL